ncbi:hypothetical protein WBJ53_18270 [Spirosoma sp. SC4-14]|uniref:hypothetical protein n=1 Tax=Spirosoma sp. SC4-14 TaxID=3128900 RepID=UPI0030CFD1AD
MNRFSVIYLHRKQYHHLYSATQAEADALLAELASRKGHTPIGSYDAKTELFSWKPDLQQHYDQATIEEQGKSGDYMIRIAQELRQHDQSTAEQRLQAMAQPQLFSTNEV